MLMQALKQDANGTAGAKPSPWDSAERNFTTASAVIEQIYSLKRLYRLVIATDDPLQQANW
jgi:hypothetical protein